MPTLRPWCARRSPALSYSTSKTHSTRGLRQLPPAKVFCRKSTSLIDYHDCMSIVAGWRSFQSVSQASGASRCSLRSGGLSGRPFPEWTPRHVQDGFLARTMQNFCLGGLVAAMWTATVPKTLANTRNEALHAHRRGLQSGPNEKRGAHDAIL